MFRPRLIAAVLLGLALAAGTASAQTPTTPNHSARVRPAERLRMQARRIQRGVKLGRIDAAERARLVKGAQAIREQLRALRQRGEKATMAERQAIRQSLNRMNRAIIQAIRHR